MAYRNASVVFCALLGFYLQAAEATSSELLHELPRIFGNRRKGAWKHETVQLQLPKMHASHAAIASQVVKQPAVQPLGAMQPLGSAATPMSAVPSSVTTGVAASEAAPSVAMVPDDEVTPEPAASANSQPPAVLKQLHNDLVEVKQMHTNVQTVEQVLAADVSLLRESAMLQKMSSSPKARAAAQQQLKQTERLVKDTETMVFKSRQTAIARAKEALREAQEVQKAADALSAEARSQLKFMEKKKSVDAAAMPVHAATPVQPTAAPKPDMDDDKEDSDIAAAATDDVAM